MYTSLAATSGTIRQLLAEAMASDIGPSGLASFFTGTTVVSLETPQEMMSASRQGLSVWLYRVTRDDNRLNQPPEIRTLPSGRNEIVPPPLPLRLHYLITPIAAGSADSPETEQRILGRALQLFHTYPVLAGALLRSDLAGSDAEVHVHLEALGLEEITRVWEALEGSYQLSVSYEVTLANIHSEAAPLRVELVESVQAGMAAIVARGA